MTLWNLFARILAWLFGMIRIILACRHVTDIDDDDEPSPAARNVPSPVTHVSLPRHATCLHEEADLLQWNGSGVGHLGGTPFATHESCWCTHSLFARFLLDQLILLPCCFYYFRNDVESKTRVNIAMECGSEKWKAASPFLLFFLPVGVIMDTAYRRVNLLANWDFLNYLPLS